MMIFLTLLYHSIFVSSTEYQPEMHGLTFRVGLGGLIFHFQSNRHNEGMALSMRISLIAIFVTPKTL